MFYTINNHGDWLEKEASDFINTNIQAYELIWQIYIGHQGNGLMAVMNNISEEDEKVRLNFSQYHYTILESLYFMEKLVDDVSNTIEINSFEAYRKILNQIIAYQAYSGRLRDNMEKCFSLVAAQEEAKKATDILDSFYHERHVFLHGRKVPFAIDADNLFKIAPIKRDTSSRSGFGMEMPWDSISSDEMIYMEDALKKSLNELKPLVQDLLSHLLSFIKEIVKIRKLSIAPPTQSSYYTTPLSGSTFQPSTACSHTYEVSGSTRSFK